MESKLMELSARPDIYELLAQSLAPSIWGMDNVKKGILLQLFGGTNKSIARGGGGGGPRYRGDINVLLIGDPGTSKSQILKVSLGRRFSEKLWTHYPFPSMCTKSLLEGSTPPGRVRPRWV